VKIRFCLAWLTKGASLGKAFKRAPSQALFEAYIQRIKRFAPCEIVPLPEVRSQGVKRWVCDRARAKRSASSEETARELEKVLGSGMQSLEIVIGGPDGIAPEMWNQLKPDWIWSFGPLTLTHELAAVVAAEQIYRGWSVIKHLPYHTAH